MKAIFILSAILFLSFYSFSQTTDLPIDQETKKITFTEAVDVASAKKVTICTRASNFCKQKQFLAKTKQDPGTFAFKGRLTLNYPSVTAGKFDQGFVDFICTVYCKDGKYKYVISDFKHLGKSGRGDGGALEENNPECGKYVLSLGSWKKIKQDVAFEMPAMIKEMKQTMAGTTTVQTKKKNPSDF